MDFVLIGALTTVLFAAVLQLGLVLHIRSTLVDCAAEGARHGAMADRTPADGAARARELVEMSLHASFAQHVSARQVTEDGSTLVRVEIHAPLPLIGLIGPGGAMTVSGHAMQEGR